MAGDLIRRRECMAELEGRTLDRYELRRLIGKGGMANVYEAYDPNFHRVVAVKVFKREDEEMLRRFIREAQLMAGLHHPHLVEVYDTGECMLDGVMRYYIVMPMLTGGTLRLRIRRSPLSLSEVCQCLSDIAGALDYIHHEGNVPRDIKASNVLLNDEGRCYLTDFGIARITSDATQLTSTGNVLGTVDYVAPELFETHRKADAPSDLYSLGVLPYELVTGQLPFTAENQIALVTMHMNKRPPAPRTIAPHVPAQVERVMMKALEKKPEQRYSSATDLANAFCRAVSNNKDGAKSASAIEQAALVLPPMESLQAIPVHGQDAQAPSYFDYPTVAATEQFPVGAAGATPAFPDPAPAPAGQSFRATPAAPARRPAPRKARRSRSSYRRRGVIVAVLALITLLAVLVPITYFLLNARPDRKSTRL